MDPQDNPAPTIEFSAIGVRYCIHCEAETVQVAGGFGLENDEGNGSCACLQCIADGGTCCSLAPLNRRQP